MEADAYEVCRRIRRYQQKNGYAMRRFDLDVCDAFLDLLEENGVIELLAYYEGGPRNCVVLTEKGRRMADAPLRRH